MTLVGSHNLLLNRSNEASLEVPKGGCSIIEVQYATIGVVAISYNSILQHIGLCKLTPNASLVGVATRYSRSRKIKILQLFAFPYALENVTSNTPKFALRESRRMNSNE